MANGVITIGGQKYAAGLYWQLSPSTRNVAGAAKAAAKQPGYQAEFYCERPATKARSIAQFGLGLRDAGHTSGMPVAAACLANQHPGSWAGAFRVPEGIWFIVVREDLVDLDGDAVFTDEDEAQVRLEQEIARGGIIKIYAPPEWGIEAADDTSLPSLLSGRKDVVLKRTDATKRTVITLVILVLIAGLIFAGYSYYNAEQKRKAEEEAARIAEMERQRRTALGLTTIPAYRKDWEFAPLPQDWLKACEDEFQKINITALGFKLSDLDCSGTAISVQWSKLQNMPAVVPENAALDQSLSTASGSYPIATLKERGLESLVNRDLINRLAILNQWPVTFTDVPDDVIVVPEGQQPPPPPPWRKRKITFTLTSSPFSQISQFQGFPGLVLTSLKLNNNSWTLEGMFYETRTP